MGNETIYNLSMKSINGFDEHADEISKRSGYRHLFDNEPHKWYRHEEVMLSYSEQNPDIEFRLEGYGDENEDIWVKWFKGGKMQQWYPQYVIPEEPPLAWEEAP